MNAVAAQEIKRRGIAAVDSLIAQGPVRIVKSNRPRYVIMTDADYETMLGDLAEARLAASEADVKVGRVRRGTAAQLIRELHKGG
ncbi:MAG: prevent-host-death protein [Lentisphaerae bacterium]|nr:prevent-host-death protein [Lentisphaerota bacterium]